MEIAKKIRKSLCFTNLFCVRRSPRSNEPAARPRGRCEASWPIYRPALWPHIQSVFVSSTAFGEWCAVRQASRLHQHEQAAILLQVGLS
jgi:hypothetical protein